MDLHAQLGEIALGLFEPQLQYPPRKSSKLLFPLPNARNQSKLETKGLHLGVDSQLKTNLTLNEGEKTLETFSPA